MLEDICCEFLQNKINWQDAFHMLLKIHSQGKRKQFAMESCLKVFWYRPPYELELMFNNFQFLCRTPMDIFILFLQSDCLQIQESKIWEACVKWNFIQQFKAKRKEYNPEGLDRRQIQALVLSLSLA